MALLFLALIVVLHPDFIAAADECGHVMSISVVLQSAPQLDGNIVCARGVIAVQMNSRGEYSVAQEMTSLGEDKHGAQHASASGLIEWDKETGISPDLYKPESFKVIEQSAERGRRILLDVTVRAGVMYKRRLLEKAREVAKHALGVDPFKGPQRDVELVLLEVVKVNGKVRDEAVRAQ